jgi:hypothetical protein
VVFAKHLDRLIRRRFAVAIELSQTSFARCHFSGSPLPIDRAPRPFPALNGGVDRKPHRANEVSV